jgi:hypothetical protein
LSFEDWLYRKADQNAHNEILALLMMIMGINLVIGGLVVTVVVVGEAVLLPFISQQPQNQSAMIGFTLTLAGFIILAAGFVLVVHYDRERSWYVGETMKSTMYRKKKPTAKTMSDALQELAEQRKG